MKAPLEKSERGGLFLWRSKVIRRIREVVIFMEALTRLTLHHTSSWMPLCLGWGMGGCALFSVILSSTGIPKCLRSPPSFIADRNHARSPQLRLEHLHLLRRIKSRYQEQGDDTTRCYCGGRRNSYAAEGISYSITCGLAGAASTNCRSRTRPPVCCAGH